MSASLVCNRSVKAPTVKIARLSSYLKESFTLYIVNCRVPIELAHIDVQLDCLHSELFYISNYVLEFLHKFTFTLIQAAVRLSTEI